MRRRILPLGCGEMGLTKRQQALLRTMIDVHTNGCEEPFVFSTTHTEPPTLIYPSPVGSVDVEADDTDLRELEREGLITLTLSSRGSIRGKPTSKGIEIVGRNFSDISSSRHNDGSISPSLPVPQAVK